MQLCQFCCSADVWPVIVCTNTDTKGKTRESGIYFKIFEKNTMQFMWIFFILSCFRWYLLSLHSLISTIICASWVIIMINSSMNMYVTTCFGDLVLFSSKLIVSPLFCSHGTWKKPTLSYIYIQMRKMRNE